MNSSSAGAYEQRLIQVLVHLSSLYLVDVVQILTSVFFYKPIILRKKEFFLSIISLQKKAEVGIYSYKPLP